MQANVGVHAQRQCNPNLLFQTEKLTQMAVLSGTVEICDNNVTTKPLLPQPSSSKEHHAFFQITAPRSRLF
jgi:hypothetical protein